MAQTYSSKGKVFLTQHQFDSRKDAGTLQTGIEYMIIDDPNTIELSDGSISLLASNGVMIIGKSAEEPYLTIGTGNQVLVDTPKVARQVANKKYVDDGLAKKQDKLSANSPLYIESSSIGIKCGDGLYVDSSNGLLAVNWDDIPLEENSPLYISCNRLSFSLYEPLCLTSCNSLWLNYGHGLDNFSDSCNQSVLGVACDSSSPLYINDISKLSLKCSSPLYIDTSNDNILSVDISEIASNIAGDGLTYNGTTNKLDADTYTTTSNTVTISDKTLTTIRATSSTIHFNSSNWVELTITRDGNNYSCWGMAQDKATTCNQYIYTVVGNTTDGAVTLDSTAFITETKVR